MGVRSSLSLFVVFSLVASACGRTEKQGPSSSSGGSPRDSGGAPNVDDNGPNCAVSISAQRSRFCAVYQNGSVWCWGTNDDLGPDDFVGTPEPVRVDVPPMKSVAVGEIHSCARNESNEIWCWGDNDRGQLGPEPGSAPRRVVAHTQAIVGLSVGGTQTCFVDQLWHLYCLGSQFPNVPRGLRQIDLPMGTRPALPNAEALAVDEHGRVYDLAWPTPIPLRSFGNDNASVSIAAVPPYCVVKSNGSLWCSPFAYGSDASILFAEPSLVETVAFVDVGLAFACALTSDARVWCKGLNISGQLGRGTTSEKELGDYVSDLAPVHDLAVADAAACAVTRDGRVLCWGAYGEGQLSNEPVEVSGCDDQEQPPAIRTPPLRSEHATLMRLAEAGQAQSQAACRCSFPVDVDDAKRQGFADCVAATDSAPNPICLAALEPTEANGVWDCRADQLWEEASCLASQECGDGFPANCGNPDCEASAKLPNIARYCSLRPACEPVKNAELFAGSSSVPSKDQLCDGYVDCVDGSDELNCTPGAAIFHCLSGQDVDPTTVCDGVADCDDASDEACQ